MHKQGEIGSPLCKVSPVEGYIYRGVTKTDLSYSVKYEWLRSLQSIPEGTQSYSTKFFVCVPLSFCTNCTRNDHSYPQWVIVPIKESYQFTSLVCFFSSIYSCFEKGCRKRCTRQSRKVLGIVGGFEFTVLQRNLKKWDERPWTYV